MGDDIGLADHAGARHPQRLKDPVAQEIAIEVA
jgi:hypothetical protein